MQEKEIFDDFCWNEHKKLVTADHHKIAGLMNLSHFSPFASGAPVPLHYHSDIIEIHFLAKGQRDTLIMKNGVLQSFRVMGNEIFITFPYELHSTGNLAQNRCEFYAVQLDLKAHDNFLGLNKEYSNALCRKLMALEQHHYKIGTSQISMLRTAFNLITMGTAEDSMSGVQYLTCVLSGLPYLTPVLECTNRHVDTPLRFALQYVEDHITLPITLQELADASGYSLSRFKAKFKEEIGITPADYITLQKMDRAQMLLKTTEQSITDIAYELGFSSSNYFCSVFKKTLSYSPSSYRKIFAK